LIPLFMVAPSAPLFYLYNEETGKHIYFCTVEHSKIILWIETEKKLKNLEFPKIFQPTQIHIVEIENIKAVKLKDVVYELLG